MQKHQRLIFFWSDAITSSGGVSKFKILLSKKTTFWINGILKFNPGFEIILLGSPNCKTIAWFTSLTIKIEKYAVTTSKAIIPAINFSHIHFN